MFRNRFLASLAIAAPLSVFLATVGHADPVTKLIDLGHLGVDISGDSYSNARAINDAGQVAGTSENSDGLLRATLFDHGLVTNLGVLTGGFESEARDINSSGQIAGYSDVSPGGSRAFLYTGGTMVDLGVLTGGNDSEAFALNDSGQVVGYSNTPTNYHGFLYSGGTMTDLGSLAGGDYSLAVAINNAGQVVGESDTATETHAFLYSGGVMTDLGDFGGTVSTAYGISENGYVTGSAYTTGNAEKHVFRYKDGVMEDLGTLGGTSGDGRFVNDSGDVAGESRTLAGEYHAFLYKDGVMIDLSPDADYGTATGINENGDVLYYELDESFVASCWIYQDGVRKNVGTFSPGSNCFANAWNSAGIVVGSSKTADNDTHAFMTSCRSLPSATCDTGAKNALQIKNNADDAKDQIKWKFGGGTEVAHADLGDPVGSDGYRLCIYDSHDGVPDLVSALLVQPSASWVDKDPKGFQYKDSTGAQGGVAKIQVKPGENDKSKAQFGAKGTAVQMPTKFNTTTFFESDTNVTVQLAREGGTQCWSSEFTTADLNSNTGYKAKTP